MRRPILLLFAFFISIFCIHTRVIGQTKFIRYEDFEQEYHKNSNLKELDKRYDLLDILLLDHSLKAPIYKYAPHLKDYDEFFSSLKSANDAPVGFFCAIDTIEKLFDSKVYIDKILSCVYPDDPQYRPNYKLQYPIYIKGNTAVIEFYTEDSLDKYYLNLNKGVLQIRWVYSIND
ncbi:hypothetical protein K4L44_03945 [Halosquirtibacter laminarini]|uniref:Uncharacterized protein n=1 Tax=Halosquirtibacter laminarini TaxID=3374600 RepID=A0AC61NPJ5_9BACT|nr:hypothetical protein K4L44_03945 [Prolixibacteraceae bacterium]